MKTSQEYRMKLKSTLQDIDNHNLEKIIREAMEDVRNECRLIAARHGNWPASMEIHDAIKDMQIR